MGMGRIFTIYMLTYMKLHNEIQSIQEIEDTFNSFPLIIILLKIELCSGNLQR